MAISSGINQFGTFRTWQVSTANYLSFPDFFIQKFFGRHEAGIIYFLFVYWRQMQNKERAFEFAKLGTTKLKSEDGKAYLTIFESYLNLSSRWSQDSNPL